jgi:quinolinate synthase
MLYSLKRAGSGRGADRREPAGVLRRYVKMIILPKRRGSLREGRVEVKVPEAIAARARVPIERMVAIG